jgi:hypothetical protein
MGRIGILAVWVALGATALAGGAYAGEDDGDLKTLLAECGGASVSGSDIDSCLERARLMGETDPSPKLQTLTARLERKAEQEEEDEPTPADAAQPAPIAPSGGGTPVTAGVAADKAAPHAEMH